MTELNEIINDRSFLSDGKIEVPKKSKKNVKINYKAPNINGIKKVILMYPNQRWLKEDMTTTWNPTPLTICLLA